MSYISIADSFEIRRNWTDLRLLLDDRTILRNPHKGWYYHYVDNGFARAAYRDGAKDDEYLTSFPGLNHLYLRIDWCDIEREKGVYDWSAVDEIFDRWSKYGLKFTFRLCTFEGDSADIPYATPKWVFESGARFTQLKNAIEPDYGDEIYLNLLEKLMREFGARYNGDKRVEYVDVGTFGTWGEGHTFAGSNGSFPMSVVKRHINLHLRYFPDTRVIVNDDMIQHVFPSGGAEAESELLDYCAGKGMGIRDDSLNVNWFAKNMNYNTLRGEFMFRHFWDDAPVDLEFEHYRLSDPELFRAGYPASEALRNVHATYSGFHGYADRWLSDNAAMTDYLANRLGYWYFPTGYELSECLSGLDSMFRLRLENRGFAKAYDPFELRVALISSGGGLKVIGSKYGANLSWKPGEACDTVLRLSLRGIEPGSYGVGIGLLEGETPVKLGLGCENAGGYYVAGKTEVKGL